jgi:hypothetical protein
MTKDEKIDLLDCMIRLTDDSAFYDTEERYYNADEIKEVLGEAIKLIEQPTSDDCVSRAEIKKIAKEMYLEVANMDLDVHTISDCIACTSSKCRQVLEDKLQALPLVTPTRCIAEIKFSKEDLRDICNERIESTHGTCKDCKHYYMDEDRHGYHCEKFDYTRFPVYADFYCKDFEKRGNSNGSN